MNKKRIGRGYRRDLPKHGYYGYANSVSPRDRRHWKWRKQRLLRGFDSTEIWNLDKTFVKFLLPRLKEFRRVSYSCPHAFMPDIDDRDLAFKEGRKLWLHTLDMMIKGFEIYCEDVGFATPDETKFAMRLFAENFDLLWH